MAKANLLVVEDEQDIRDLVCFSLRREGYVVRSTESGEVALEMISKQSPDLVILDLMLPGIDGLDVCRRLKADRQTEAISVLMLTARTEDADIVTGLEMGADDYLTKPFSPRVLTARVKAILRRRQQVTMPTDEVLQRHDIVLDPGRHRVMVAGNEVVLTATEFRLLHCFMRKPGRVFSRYQLVNEVQGEEAIITDRAVDVQIAGLRKKLNAAGSFIETVRGVGYRFRE